MATAPESDSTVGARLRNTRLTLGLSHSDVASPGVSRTYVSMIERGLRQPSAKAIRALARPLGVTAHWLETGRDDPAVELARRVLIANPPSSTEMRRLAQLILER